MTHSKESFDDYQKNMKSDEDGSLIASMLMASVSSKMKPKGSNYTPPRKKRKKRK